MPITPGYAAVFAVVFLVLSVRTIRLRLRARVSIGHGGDAALERAVRAHGNFAEYVPLALLMIHFLEVYGSRVGWIHLLCVALLAGRLMHAYGVSRVDEDQRLRVIGTVLTFAVMAGAAFGILVFYLHPPGA